jgi:hypothetical protein
VSAFESVPLEQRLAFTDSFHRNCADSRLALPRLISKCDAFVCLMPHKLVRELAPDLLNLAEAYRMWGLMLYMMMHIPLRAVPTGNKNVEPAAISALLADLRSTYGSGIAPPGRRKFKRLQTQLLLGPSFVRGSLSKHLASLVCEWGETVCLDEKMYAWHGETPHLMHVPSKPEPVGQWTTELVVLLDGACLPFCVGLYPFYESAASGEVIHKSDVWAWARGLLPDNRAPCIVADSFYLDRTSVRSMQDAGVRFCASVNRKFFPELVSLVEPALDTIGRTAVFNAPDEGLICIGHWSEDKKLGKQLLLTNSFRISDSRMTEVVGCTALLWYRDSFKYCDLLNRTLHDVRYPFRRKSWQKNFDSLFFSILAINAYHVWQFASPGERSEVQLKDFMTELALELMRMPSIYIENQ